MRALVVRQRLTRSAVLVASVALLAACGAKHDSTGPGGSDSIGDTAGLTAGSLLLSNGTNTVVVSGRAFTFPTTVTDAAYSPDGSRIVFVNSDGNIATARVDGSSMMVLTAKLAGAVRSRPTWSSNGVVFAEKVGTKASQLRFVVPAVDHVDERDAFLGERDDGSPDYGSGSAPSGLLAPSTRDGKEAAFQRTGAKGGEVWVSDLNQREPRQAKLVDGTEPALSPDGLRVGYVDPAGQIEVIDPVAKDAKPVQITFGVAAPSHLAWSPDGSRISFSTATDVESVLAGIPAGSTANATRQESATAGVPSYLPPARDRISRITGADPVQTTIAASQARFPTADVAMQTQSDDQATAVLLAATTSLPAMLAGAQMVDLGPLLFTSGGSLDSHTAAEIKRVLGRVTPDGFVPTVTILGGTDVISTAVENSVKAMGYTTDRVAAKDPYAMAVTAAGAPANADAVMLVDAADVSSYVSAISDLGGYSTQTVLLTNGSTMPDPVKSFLNGLKKTAKVYALGSAAQAAVAGSWSGKPALTVTAIGGNPTANLLTTYAIGPNTVVVVDSSSTTDVIAAIGLARGYGAPVLALDTKAGLDEGVKRWLDGSSGNLDRVLIVDSKGAVSADFEHAVGALVGGPLGVSSNSNPKAPPLT